MMQQNLLVRDTQRRPGETTPPAETAMMKSPVANPYMGADMRNLINTLAPGTITSQRTIAVPQCSYSQIVQIRGWLPEAISAVAWFSFDNPVKVQEYLSTPAYLPSKIIRTLWSEKL